MAKRSVPDNPYLAGKLEWNSVLGEYSRSASLWRSVAILSLTIGTIGFGYALYQSTQVKMVPYIVQVDKLGNAVSGGFPAQIEYADERVIRSTLSAWVSNFRSVTPDTVVEKGYIDRVYALLRQSDSSTQQINSFYQNNNPFDRASNMTVSVEVSNVVKLSSQSYQIDWTEIARDRKGKEISTKRWRGVATVTLSPPQDEAIIRNNPIGLYITEFNWTAQL